jgi:hypothetical protein
VTEKDKVTEKIRMEKAAAGGYVYILAPKDGLLYSSPHYKTTAIRLLL